jgi:hypothetical protein
VMPLGVILLQFAGDFAAFSEAIWGTMVAYQVGSLVWLATLRKDLLKQKSRVLT